jgi:hypothetical protein
MAPADKLFIWIAIAIDMIGPAILLLFLRRWTRRWWTAFAGTAIIAPFAAFLVTGGIAWFHTYIRVVIRGDTSIPDEIGETVAQYLGTTFSVCGVYGVMFAGTGFGFSLLPIGLWWLVHRPGFDGFTRSGS